MSKEEKELKQKKSSVKVATYTDYLAEAAKLCENGGDKFNTAVELMFADKGPDKFVTTIQKAGETRYVFKV